MDFRTLGVVGTWLALCTPAGCAASRPVFVYQKGNMSITRMDYRGWRGCYRMTNGTAQVVVVPQIARIMQYGPAGGTGPPGGDGLLFVNPELTPEATGGARPQQYPNYGGLKLWVAPQKAWDWPPHPELDRGPCRVEVQEDGALRMVGTPSSEAGVRLDRVLRLDPEGTRLQIEQLMTNVSDRPVTWAIWDVTQVASDGTAVIPLGDGAEARFGSGEQPSGQWRRLGNAYVVSRPVVAQKLFVTGGPGWLAYRKGDWLLLKSFRMPQGAPPEPETPREVWAGTGGFIELEFVGPAVTLAPGEMTKLTQEWRFFPLGAEESDGEGLVRAACRAAAAAGLMQ